MGAGLARVLEAHDDYIESFVRGFERELRGLIASAQAHTVGELQKRLSITTRGVIDKSPANQRTLRKIDDLLADSMNRAGYRTLIEEFVNGFPGQLPFVDQMLDAISENLNTPLQAALGKADQAVLASQQISTLESLNTVVEGVAALAKRRALMSVGALKFGDLVEQISTTFNRGVAEATTLAETSQVMFFRTATERAFRKIEDGLPEGAVRYRYEGPRDKLTRPFCLRMLSRSASKPLTRDQIENLDNGQLPNPFITGGGYNCRHQWVITEIRDGK
jgi:hypothetical protein